MLREKTKQPKVAFLMSVYAQERPEFLRAAIESMTGVDYPNLDIHIFQDGVLGQELSDILAAHASLTPSIYIHRHPENRGLAICLNEMITQIKDQYDYFARMDSDDVTFADRVRKQVDFMEAHPDIDVVGGFIVDMDESGRELKKVQYPQNHHEICSFFRKRNPMAHATVMYRRRFFEKAGLYPPVRLEDGLYWMQGLLAGCRFHNMPDYFVRVRRSNDFLRRRSGFKKAWEELKIKMTINRQLRFGPDAYLFSLATFFMQLLPVPIKQILYDRLR